MKTVSVEVCEAICETVKELCNNYEIRRPANRSVPVNCVTIDIRVLAINEDGEVIVSVSGDEGAWLKGRG